MHSMKISASLTQRPRASWCATAAMLRALRDGSLRPSRQLASTGLTCADVVGKYIQRLVVKQPVSDSVLLARLPWHEARWLVRDKGQARLP